MAGQEDGREGQDEEQARDDEAQASHERPGSPSQAPGAEDRELGGGGAGQEVRGGNAVFELSGGQPVALLHAQAPEQGDVRGRPAEADTADAGPLSSDRAERDGCNLMGPRRRLALVHWARYAYLVSRFTDRWPLADGFGEDLVGGLDPGKG